MVLGKQGMRIEAWKFALYLAIPISASIAFNNPERQGYWADYFQFLKYPGNPNTNLKEQFEDLRLQQEEKKQQRQEYARQLQKLQESAQKSRRLQEEEKESSTKKGWRRWFSWT